MLTTTTATAVDASDRPQDTSTPRLTQKTTSNVSVRSPDGSTTQEQVTTEPAPVTIADALNSGHSTAKEFEDEWRASFKRDPEGFHEPGKCRYCSATIPEPIVLEKGPMLFPVTVCEPCVEKGQDRYKAEQLEAQTRRFAGWVPPEFALPWDDKKGNVYLMGKVMGYAIDLNRNLVLHGDSGRCKTRCVWELVKHLSEHVQGFEFYWLDAYELATKGVPAEALKTKYLVLDDLGNEPLDRKTEAALLNLFKKRLDWHKPMFLTTQLNGAAFRDRFFPSEKHTAQAILRRLRERSDFIAAMPSTHDRTEAKHVA